MLDVREGVDNRDFCVLRQLHERLVGKNAGNYPLHVAGKRPRDVSYRFSLPKTNLVLTKVHAVASKLGNRDAEAHLRAKRRLLEQEGKALAPEGVGKFAFLLRPRSSQNGREFRRRHIGYREKAASVQCIFI